MKYKLSHVLVLCLFVAMASSWLTATVMAQSVFNKAKNRTVLVEQGFGACSGVILQTNLVLTCWHCVNGSQSIKVGGKPAKIWKTDPKSDLALLFVETIVIDRVLVADVSIGDDVFSFGFPMASPNIVYTRGYVTVIQFDGIYATTLALPGASGSALYDRSGRLVGLTTGFLQMNHNISVSTLPEKIKALWEVP